VARALQEERHDMVRGRRWSMFWSDENYRRVNALLPPHHVIGHWHIDGQRVPYVDFLLKTPEYVPEPF
jgi:hypothetical protein